METQKKTAIQNEDFDLAKQLKFQIAQLRQSAYHPGASTAAQPMPRPSDAQNAPQMMMPNPGTQPNPMAPQHPEGGAYGYPGQ